MYLADFLDFFNYSFFSRALIMSVLCGTACGIIGVWILLLNISFIGVAMAHACFAGVLTGILTGINPVFCGFIFCIITALVVDPVSKKSKLNSNTSISLMFSFMLGIAFLFMALLKNNRQQALGFMWGNILTTSYNDIIINSVIIIVLIITAFVCHKGIIAVLFNREIAGACGIPEKNIFYVLVLLSSAVISLNINAVGGLLIYALITLPAVSAYQFTYKISAMYIISAVFAIFSCVAGLFISAIFSLPAGASIVLISCAVFIVSLFISKKGLIKNYIYNN